MRSVREVDFVAVQRVSKSSDGLFGCAKPNLVSNISRRPRAFVTRASASSPSLNVHQQSNLYIPSSITTLLNLLIDIQDAFVSLPFRPKHLRRIINPPNGFARDCTRQCPKPRRRLHHFQRRQYTNCCDTAERQDHSGRNTPRR